MKSYKCDYCNSSLDLDCDVIEHLRTLNTIIKDFTCNVCKDAVAEEDFNSDFKSAHGNYKCDRYNFDSSLEIDLEVNFKAILSLFFLIEIFSIVLMGDFAPQDDALNVEKS